MPVVVKEKKLDPISFRLYHSDALSILRTLADNSIGAIITDPPYGLSEPPNALEMLRGWLSPISRHNHMTSSGGFMGAAWDEVVPQPNLWKEVLRVLKPGGFIFCFAGTKTVDLMGLSLRIAGFEPVDMIAWHYGCLDTQTEAVTIDGIKPYHKTKLGDLVLCYNLETKEYSYQPILEIMEYDYKDTAYRLVGDFGEQVVTRNHRVIIERNGEEVFCTAEHLPSKVRVPVLESLSNLQQAFHVPEFNSSKPKYALWEKLCRKTKQRKDSSNRNFETNFNNLSCVSQRGLEGYKFVKKSKNSILQSGMQWGSSRERMENPCSQGSDRVDRRFHEIILDKYEWRKQSCLERWRNFLKSWGRELREVFSQICEVPKRLFTYGTIRRVYFGISAESSNGYAEDTKISRSSSSYRSQPREQQFRESNVVQHQYTAQAVREWEGHSTNMVRVEPFKYEGKVWCLRVPTGSFVAVRNGVAFPTGNSGLSKSISISKAIDKDLGLERKVVGRDKSAYRPNAVQAHKEGQVGEFGLKGEGSGLITEHASKEAKKWNGWNTGGIKPATEPILLMKKPLDGTYIQNLRKWGVGCLNIDATRVPLAAKGEDARLGGKGTWGTEKAAANVYEGGYAGEVVGSSALGRFPANVMVSHTEECVETDGEYECHPECIILQFPDAKGQQGAVTGNEPIDDRNVYGSITGRNAFAVREETATSAARFFYQPKVRATERNKYCTTVENKHISVKPIELLANLVKMCTPKGETVLDPFTGSGTTGLACLENGFSFIGIERNKEYAALAQERLSNCLKSMSTIE